MQKLVMKLSDMKGIKDMHWRHILQSVLGFSCFCALDTVAQGDSGLWLVSAAAVVAAILGIFFLARRVEIGRWSNVFNVVSAALLVGCHFLTALYPVAMFFITLTAGVRFLYARQKLNDYCTLFVVLVSVFGGIVLRFALALLPIWVLGLFMLATLFNPVVKRTGTVQEGSPADSADKKKNTLMLATAALLVLLFLCIEVFGGPLTDEVSHLFPMQMVNIAYLVGYILFIVAVMVFRIKPVGLVIVTLSIIGLFFFLIPLTSTFGIYFLLLLGGGMKVLMLSIPITTFRGKNGDLGVLGGVFVYRLAFLASGTVEALAPNQWHVSSPMSYALAAINILLGIGTVFMLAYWDRRELKLAAQNAVVTVEVIKEIVVVQEAPTLSLPADFTEREKEIAQLILKGDNVETIAENLFISVGTVRNHIKNILRKSDCQSQRMFIVKFGARQAEE